MESYPQKEFLIKPPHNHQIIPVSKKKLKLVDYSVAKRKGIFDQIPNFELAMPSCLASSLLNQAEYKVVKDALEENYDFNSN